MNIVELQVGGKPLIFTDESVKYDKYEFLYEKMSDISHQAGNKPLFIFRYGEKRIGIPYDLKDEAIIVKMITRIAGILMDRKAPAKHHENDEITALPQKQQPKSVKNKKGKKQPTKKDTAIGCISLIVILIIIIFAISQCGGEDSFTKEDAVKYDNDIDSILISVDRRESAFVEDWVKYGTGEYSDTEFYSKLESYKKLLYSNWKSLGDIDGNTEYKNSAERYAFNYYQVCKDMQEAINENDLSKMEDAKTRIALRDDYKSEVIKERKAFLKESGVSDNEIDKRINQKYTFK